VSECIESSIQIEESDLFETRIILHRQICCQSHGIASALLGGAGSTVVHQDLPHDARCNGQEMYSARKLALIIPNEFHVCLMN
jgi:hypothetical protein